MARCEDCERPLPPQIFEVECVRMETGAFFVHSSSKWVTLLKSLEALVTKDKILRISFEKGIQSVLEINWKRDGFILSDSEPNIYEMKVTYKGAIRTDVFFKFCGQSKVRVHLYWLNEWHALETPFKVIWLESSFIISAC